MAAPICMIAILRPLGTLLLAIFMLMAGSGFLATLVSLRLQASGASALVVGLVATPSAVGPFATETNSGVTADFLMSSAGTFPYYCSFHYPAGMYGTVFVQ